MNKNLASPYSITSGNNPLFLVLFINGYSRPGKDFLPLIKRIHKKIPNSLLVAVDNPGFGNHIVHKEESLTISSMAEKNIKIAQDLMKQHSIPSYTILGASMGGMIAQEMIKKDPKILSSILLTTTRQGKLSQGGSATLEDYFGSRFLEKKRNFAHVFFQKNQEEQKKNEILLQQQRTAIQNFFLEDNFLQNFPKTLLIAGEEDNIIPLPLMKELHEKIENSSLKIYSQIGHLPLVEAPTKLESDIVEFLLEHPNL